MEGHRAERVAEALRGELEELICCELEDPRVKVESVTEVRVSPDSRKALVLVRLAGDAEAAASLAALDRAKPFLKKQLAERLDLFRLPDLTFESDLGEGLAPRAAQLLKRIRKGRPKG